MGQDEPAMADAAAALQMQPQNVNLRLLRANILYRKGDLSATAHEADALIAASPQNHYALVAAARIYAAIGRQEDAMRTLATALALKPKPYIYINRYCVRPKSDVAGRQADLDAALKLDPGLSEGIEAKADFQGERGDWRGAATILTTLIAKTPDDAELLNRRGIAYAKAGDQALAVTDFDAARAAAKTATLLNNLCWGKATAGVALDRALAECDAALALAPDSINIHDSHAFVLLRLDRLDEALAEYGGVLAKAPTRAGSLYGRAITEARKGNRVDADRDVAAALKSDPQERERFDGYGMKMPVADKPSTKPTA
jgi:tetratricopeptide (TPR) repeat protein